MDPIVSPFHIFLAVMCFLMGSVAASIYWSERVRVLSNELRYAQSLLEASLSKPHVR